MSSNDEGSAIDEEGKITFIEQYSDKKNEGAAPSDEDIDIKDIMNQEDSSSEEEKDGKEDARSTEEIIN
jgi:hypothetical protein